MESFAAPAELSFSTTTRGDSELCHSQPKQLDDIEGLVDTQLQPIGCGTSTSAPIPTSTYPELKSSRLTMQHSGGNSQSDTLDIEGPTEIQFELIQLGTGPSTPLPKISCLTSLQEPACKACLTTLAKDDPEAQKNKRMNTSAVLKVFGSAGDGSFKTILIDASCLFLLLCNLDDTLTHTSHFGNY